jgi:MFS family permease
VNADGPVNGYANAATPVEGSAGASTASPGQPGRTLRGGLPNIVRALRARNYRLFFCGQLVSLVGTWMQMVAVSWLAFRLTGSALVLGSLGLVSQLPALVLAPVAGVLADRWNLRRILVTTQVLACVQASILATLTLTHVVTLWHLYALSFLLGLINAFDMPTRQAFVPRMIERPEDLSNAIALNSSIVNASRMLGPALAGLLIVTFGSEGACFLLNAVSYGPVILALLAMRLGPHRPAARHASLGRGLAEGFAYAFGFPPIRDILGLLALTSLLGMSYGTIMPIFAADILHGRADTYGFLMGVTGLGAFFGAIYLASLPSVRGLGRIIGFGTGLFGASLVAVSFVRSVELALSLMLFAGLGMMLQIAATNTMLQTLVDDDKRGRVMAIYMMAFLGMTPFGSMIAGSIAHAIGTPGAILIAGASCLIGAAVFLVRLPALRPHVRPIYVRKGIIVETPAPAAERVPETLSTSGRR